MCVFKSFLLFYVYFFVKLCSFRVVVSFYNKLINCDKLIHSFILFILKLLFKKVHFETRNFGSLKQVVRSEFSLMLSIVNSSNTTLLFLSIVNYM